MARPQTKDTIINIKATLLARDLIDLAARAVNKNRTDFVLDAASAEAEHVLLDRRLFYVNEAVFEALNKRLNAPVEKNPALEKLLNKKAPWEN